MRAAAKSSQSLVLGSQTLAEGMKPAGTFTMESSEGSDLVLVPVR